MMNEQMNALHVVSLYLNTKRALNGSLQNSLCEVGCFKIALWPPRLMLGPPVLSVEYAAKKKFTTRYGREKAIMFNHFSLGEKKKRKTFENVLFPIIRRHTLPVKICFSEKQKSFTLGEHNVA